MNGSTELKDYANEYFKRGWVPLALGYDSQGYPKRPLATAWTSIAHNAKQVRNQPWDNAKVIGILLGSPSNNLGVIDIDDVEMAQEVYQLFIVDMGMKTRWIWTARNRGHFYVRERTPSKSRAFKLQWQGKEVQIELKSEGTQVATYPSEGYSVGLDAPPIELDLDHVFQLIQEKLGARFTRTTITNAGYPSPWAELVSEGDRNKAIYVEAHQLRQAGVPLNLAIDIMVARVGNHFAEGVKSDEITNTVRSAYRKPVPELHTDRLRKEESDLDNYF